MLGRSAKAGRSTVLLHDGYADRRYEQQAEAIDYLESVFRPFLDALRIEDELVR
jgi:hypothetical protein